MKKLTVILSQRRRISLFGELRDCQVVRLRRTPRNDFILFFLFFGLALLAGCATAPHTIGYKIEIPEQKIKKPLTISVLTFADKRPNEERKGLKGELLVFSTKDKDFAQPPALLISQQLTKELMAYGFKAETTGVINVAPTIQEPTDYRLEGELLHFQEVIKLNKSTLIPYLGNVITLWAKDKFVIVLSMRVKLFSENSAEPLFDEEFNVDKNLKLPTGILNLARYKRGLRHRLKLLDLATKEVLGKVCHRVIQELDETP